jgi:hypothetical protein
MPNRSWIHGSPVEAALAAIVAVALTAAAFALQFQVPAGGANTPDPVTVIVYLSLTGGMAGMGALVASRRPAHPIGWLMIGSANLIALSILCGSYADFSVARHAGSLPGTVLAAWLASWSFLPNLGVLGVVIPMLYPTGRFLTARWRRFGLALITIGIAGTLAAALTPGPLNSEPSIVNPFGATAIAGLVTVVGVVSNVSAPVGFVGALLSLALRYRRGGSVERQQIKLFLYPMAIAVVALSVSIPNNGPVSDVAWVVGLAALAAVPVAIAVAIVRHGLFDIDRLIKRTLVYGVLSVMLAVLYAGCVLAAQPLVATLTGGTELAVAAATLVAAALFQPLRRRVQRAVDRRFDRGAYDGQQLVAAFAGRLRDRVYLDDITAELTATATQALRPAGVSVWLRHRTTGR